MLVGGRVGWAGSGSLLGSGSSLPRPPYKLVQGDGLGVWGPQIRELGSENRTPPLGLQAIRSGSGWVAGQTALVAVVAEVGVSGGIMLVSGGCHGGGR